MAQFTTGFPFAGGADALARGSGAVARIETVGGKPGRDHLAPAVGRRDRNPSQPRSRQPDSPVGSLPDPGLSQEHTGRTYATGRRHVRTFDAGESKAARGLG